MTEDGQERYYLQDEMGSPIRLMDEDGDLKDSYGYDEFGQDLYGNQGIVQPFGYTGYQADRITGIYYAQAREYRAELGRFAAVDTIKGFTVAPYTLNEYGYCWNKPTVLVDFDGKYPTVTGIKERNKDEFSSYNSENKGGTSTYGLNLSGTLGVFAIDGSIGFSFDYMGNIAVQATGAWGVTASSTPSCAIAVFETITNAPSVDCLNEDGGCIGGAIAFPVCGVPIYAGVDFVIAGDLNNKPIDNENYYGYTKAAGIGSPGAEIHGEMSYTVTLTEINIFEWILDLLSSKDNDECIE